MTDPTNDRRPADPGAAPTTGGTEHDKVEQDLKATADAIRTDIDRLAAMESEKARLDPESPEVDRISAEAVDVAARIHRETLAERQLSEELG